MTVEPLPSRQTLPSCELLSRLLSIVEAEPRRAPDDIVGLVRREVERLAADGRAHTRNEPVKQ